METVCRSIPGHWCAECCDGRDCPRYGELPDGTWGCLTHPDKFQICKDVNCLVEMGLPLDVAIEKVKTLPEGEFFASNLAGENCNSSEW